MSPRAKKQSNPVSTGSGGGRFENHVQAAFAVLMLTGRIAPCLPPWSITKLKLQGQYADFDTEDFIVFTKDYQSDREAKLLAQIKHTIRITEGDKSFGEVIQAAWNDFNNPKIFSRGTDAIALITGSLNATDTNDVRPLLEWARHSEDENEFLLKVNTSNFCSNAKRAKLKAFRKHLRNANGGKDLTDCQLWEFLKHFYLLGYDLDTESGGTLSLLQSLIAQSSNDNPAKTWKNLVVEIQTFNQTAGTFSLENISEELRNSFDTKKNPHWVSDIKKLQNHGEYIIDGIKSDIGGVSIDRRDLFKQLVDISEETEFVFISGERGCGKSSLVQAFAEYTKNKSPIFCLRTEDLDKAHLDSVFSAIGLTSSLEDIGAGFALMPKRYLLIESLEKLLELENTAAFNDLLQFVKSHPGWTIIASGRDYAYQQISFNFLQPSGVRHSPLVISGFNDDEIQYLCEKFESLRSLAKNQSLRPLLKNPFFANLAYRVTQVGTEFSSEDDEKEFQKAVWRDVISKESVRTDGLPLKRKQTFIDISVKRAKQMVYGVPDREFDPFTLQKLEEDNLVRRESSSSLVSPSHDVLEDWSLEKYIEEEFQATFGEIHEFLKAVGHEPAMNRAFRQWLYQKLKFGEDVKSLILDILSDNEIERCWQDETITAVLLGNDSHKFLEELSDQLFANDNELLKRFCFILRISCKIPDQDLIEQFSEEDKKRYGILNSQVLRPYGQGWESIIRFLYENRDRVSEEFLPHISTVLSEWSSLIHVERELPSPARKAGLLSLHLLDTSKNSYQYEDDRKKILNVIMRVVPAIPQEFNTLLENEVFSTHGDERHPRYLRDLITASLTGIETVFLCKHAPDTVIKIAFHEWFIVDREEDQSGYRSSIDTDEYFGLKGHRPGIDFPPSGLKGPFQHLLRYHPKKGLDFIIRLLNTTAEKYAISDLDTPEKYSSLPEFVVPSDVEQVEVRLNDGTVIKQYCSERLWLGYRGQSVIPYLLQSALMALENWLIIIAEQSRHQDSLKAIFHYILKNSNSVMSTALLASVATGFPDTLGKAALPILRTKEFYDLDLKRANHERGEKETGWFHGQFDPLGDYYAAERGKAATRPWRKKNLEDLIVRLQFTDLQSDTYAILDELYPVTHKEENWRFRLHRIDSRTWEPKIDEDNKTIIFTSQNLEPDLIESQRKAQEKLDLYSRFASLFVWSGKTFKKEPLDRDYYTDWRTALEEAKCLHKIIHDNTIGLFTGGIPADILIFQGSLVKSAAIFLRDHSSELGDEDCSWCINLVVTAASINANSNNPAAISDVTDLDGAASAASVLPIIIDHVSNDDDILTVKECIAVALTHANANVCSATADGIREHMWQKEPDFAQKCIQSIVEYAQMKAMEQKRSYRAPENQKEWLEKFRKQVARGEITTDINEVTLHSHHPEYLVISTLMIPNGSTDPVHISFLTRILTLFIEVEITQNTPIRKDTDEINVHYELPMKFGRKLAEFLFECSDPKSHWELIQKLKLGCEKAPTLVNWVLLCIQLFAENTGRRDRYWWFWDQLSEDVQNVAVHMVEEKIRNKQEKSEQRKLIRSMLFADMRAEHVDHERNNIMLGKESIIHFVDIAGANPDVFEAMSSLIFNYPDLFTESGLIILSKHQKKIGGTQLLSSNTVFYLERSISRVLLLDSASPLSKKLYSACQTLLDALTETGSSGAYYLREHLIRSRKIMNRIA